MASEEIKLIYWDACVFLEYVNGVPEHLAHIDVFLEQSLNGKQIQIVTSTVSITEVAFAQSEQDGQVLDEAVEDRISQLWAPHSPVKLIEFHALIAEYAKNLMRHAITQQPQSWKLKPLDAIHLATAKIHGAQEFHTYDPKLKKYETYLGIPIGPPISATPRLVF